MKDKIFLDTNVLVYLVDKKNEFHRTVKEMFENIVKEYEIWISRQVLREYAVVISRKALVEKPLIASQVIDDIAKWEKLFKVIDETRDVTENLKRLILKYNLKGKRIHDANIVASMIKHSIPLVFTFNIKDFKAFEEVQLLGIQSQDDGEPQPETREV
jgi:predicted nucleic acid-binding protein